MGKFRGFTGLPGLPGYWPTGRCACGKPLHYSDESVRTKVEKTVLVHGPHITLVYGGHKYLVQVHFLNLHGIHGLDLEGWAKRGIIHLVE